jgi:hypothetical protein
MFDSEDLLNEVKDSTKTGFHLVAISSEKVKEFFWRVNVL